MGIESLPPSPHPFRKYRKMTLARRYLRRKSLLEVRFASKYESSLTTVVEGDTVGDTVISDLWMERASWCRDVLKLDEWPET
jgi:hypothetical protein